MVRLKQIWMWLSLREVCTWCTCILWHFSKQIYPLTFDLFFPLTTIPRTTSNCTSAWVGEQQVSGALTPDLLPLPFSWTGIAAVRAIPPAPWWLQEQGSCIAARLLPAVQPLASWILAMPISHGLQPDRTQVTGSDWQWKAWLDCSRATSQISFIHLDPFRRIHFGSSKHTSSTLQRHFGFVWKKGKEATVNTQLLIVQYKKKEQCDQRGHSQLSHGYSEPARIIHSSNTQLGFGAGFISEDTELLVPLQ